MYVNLFVYFLFSGVNFRQHGLEISFSISMSYGVVYERCIFRYKSYMCQLNLDLDGDILFVSLVIHAFEMANFVAH